jgi:ribosome-binding factor A
VKRPSEHRRGAATGGPSRRVERVAGELQRLLGTLLVQRVSDPRLTDVVVTRVKITPDLRLAKVAVHSLAVDGGDSRSILAGLEAAAPYFKREVAAGLDLRYTPDLRFFWDEQLDEVRRIDALLRKARPAPEADPERSEGGAEGDDEGEDT